MHRRLLDVTQNRTLDSGPVSESSFDTNMLIILAALLCSLIGALGLNSMVRCALRCSRRLAPGREEQATARMVATGLKKRDLWQIPVAAYGPGGQIAATECAICLAEFVEGEKVRVLPECKHGFHVRCIDTWLGSHPSCPNCRHSICDKTDEPGSDATREVSGERRMTGVEVGPPE